MSNSTLRSQILSMARRRKSGLTAGDVLTKFTWSSRSSVSAAMTELTNCGFLSNTGSFRKSPVSGKLNTVYSA